MDIPGATLPSYTTPPTTLWDVGSEYRCVVSNSSGVTRSRPGVVILQEAPAEGPHRIVGMWSYQHAGRRYTREFTRDNRCILRDEGVVGWTKPYTVVDERSVLVEGGFRHELTGPDSLDIEGAFKGIRIP